MSDPQFVPMDGPAPFLSSDLFRRRRDRLRTRLGDGVALVPSAPELLISRDTEVTYRPGSDLYYLTGLREPQALAVIAGHGAARPFVLFVRPREPEHERWTGGRLGVDGARELTGAAEVYPITEMAQRLPELVAGASEIHYPIGLLDELDRLVRDLLVGSRRGRARTGRGPSAVHDLDNTVGPLRRIKEPEEIERIRIAAQISREGHAAAREAIRPGAGEWEVQAALEATFRRFGADRPAFPSIVGSGPNATVLHYTANDRRIGEDDLVLIDAGAEWGLYCTDITRTHPASGTFTPAQQAVYDVVDEARRAAIEQARSGSSVAALHDTAVRILSRGMLDLKLLRLTDLDEVVETYAYKRFYMHQTSHWIGLDVHDVGLYQEEGEPVVLAPGMVLTVEPGLYIPLEDDEVPAEFRGIGVRLEDTLVVTDGAADVLTGE